MLSRGQSRRLEKRFASLDVELNRRVGAFAIAALAAMLLILLMPQRVGSPQWLARGLVVVYCVGIVPAFALFYSWSANELSRRYGLQCSRCGQALRKLSLRRRRRDDPDYCADGEVPSRCPHCRVSIDVATEDTAAGS